MDHFCGTLWVAYTCIIVVDSYIEEGLVCHSFIVPLLCNSHPPLVSRSVLAQLDGE